MDLELKSDLERKDYLRDLGDPILHDANEAIPEAIPEAKVEESEEETPQPLTSATQEVAPVVLEPVIENVPTADDAPLLVEPPAHVAPPQAEDLQLPILPAVASAAPITQDFTPTRKTTPLPPLSETEQPVVQEQPPPVKSPAPLTPPSKEPDAVQRTRRWSKGMFAALTSRNDKS